MVALVQCDGNGSICFNSAAKSHVACTVPRTSNHATTFGIARSCSLWSHDCHRSASWPTTAECRGQSTCAHAAWRIFCCVNHIKLARDQLAKHGGIRICWKGVQSKRYRAHCPLVFGVCRPQSRPEQVNWNRGRSCSRRNRSRSGEMLRPRIGRNHNSRRACGLHTRIQRVPRRRRRRAPRPIMGVRRPVLPVQCTLVWHPQSHQDQQPQQHLQQQPRQPQHRHAVKRWPCSTQLRKGSMSSMPRLTTLLGKCRFSWISPVKLCERTSALQPMQVLNRRYGSGPLVCTVCFGHHPERQ